MKIDTDLRIAIRAAEKAQPDNWKIRNAAEQKAIKELLARPRMKARFNALKKAVDAAAKKLNTATENLGKLGISDDGERIRNIDNFIKAGGTQIPPEARRWKADVVLSELVKAQPSQRKAILARYGIIWE